MVGGVGIKLPMSHIFPSQFRCIPKTLFTTTPLVKSKMGSILVNGSKNYRYLITVNIY